MRKIVISSQKGGAGKTTLAAALAVEAERCGDGPVSLIDTDQQATLTDWYKRRSVAEPEVSDMQLSQLRRTLPAIEAEGKTFCIIDTAPTVTDDNKKIIELADLVIIPVHPSPLDAWAVGPTVQAAKDKGKPFLFVMTKANAQAKVTAETIAALSQHGPVVPAFVANRVAYATSMATGRTAPETSPDGPAAQEIAAVWQEVKSKFPEFAKSQNRKIAKAGKEAEHA